MALLRSACKILPAVAVAGMVVKTAIVTACETVVEAMVVAAEEAVIEAPPGLI